MRTAPPVRRPRRAGPPPFREGPVWEAIGAEWRQLGGGFRQLGFSFEWQEFAAGEDEVDWSPSFHPGSVEICLNLAGQGHVALGTQRAELRPFSGAFYSAGPQPLEARRRGGQRHRFITVELSPGFLRRHLQPHQAALHPSLQPLVETGGAVSAVGPAVTLSARQQQLVASLREPPVHVAAQLLWYQSKALELMVEFLFQPAGPQELFCARAKRVARERVDKTMAILRTRLAEPPSLEELGRLVGCSPFYLSRTFSTEAGMTIPQFLRQIRMDRAAELLRSGRFNVTEAALEVGYSSLSHFSQAFHEGFGCSPGLYPMATLPQKALRKDA